jgi:hypothetical protein
MKLSKTGKYHISYKTMKKLKNNYYNKHGILKPSGFWYSIGSQWLDFKLNTKWNNNGIRKKGTEYHLKSPLTMYKIKFYNKKYTSLPDDEKVLLVDTCDKLLKFNKNYSKTGNSIFIDWEKVSQDYAGIEFRNYSRIKKELIKKKLDILWYSAIDVDSGCVWKPSKVIKTIDKMT